MTNIGSMLDVPDHARPAWVSLVAALDRMRDQGLTPVCSRRPGDWSSEAPARVRRDAVEACTFCPVRKPCADYADEAEERCHVWGGTDRTPPSKRQEATA